MNRFVLDNSVTMRWLFGDGSSGDQKYAKSVLNSIPDGHVIVPSIWSLEVANVIARAERKFGLTEARSADFLQVLSQMHIQVDSETDQRAFGGIVQLARRFNLSAYDASYLELALREAMPLATLDEGLQKACKKVGVNLFSPLHK
ncbi:putative nucleic acid-binding protein [Oxalobacteraceae bacterium GrIS 2.11]